MNISETILGYIRVATVSPKVYPGEVKKNVEIHKQAIQSLLLEDPGIRLIVFPELSLTGYTCGDLFLTSDLIENTKRGIQELSEFVKKLNGPAVIFGAPTIDNDSRLHNSAIVVGDTGYQIVRKINLPFYQEFYEKRWFSPGDNDNWIFTIDGVKIGIEICEDLWVANPPCEKLVTELGAEVIINISASPKLAGKYDYLKNLVKITSGRLMCSYVYVSSGPWESSTDLVFSGWSMVYENANKIAELPPIVSLKEEMRYLITDIDIHEIRGARRKSSLKTRNVYDNSILPSIDNNERIEKSPYREYDPYPFLKENNYLDTFTIQSLGLQKRVMSCGGENCKLIIGVSGGTDSTLALLVAADAMDKLGFPRTNIIGVTLPCFGTTARTKDNSWKLMNLLGIDGREICIKESVTAHLKELGHSLDVYDIAYENAQARMRTQVLFNLSNMEGGIVLGTGDLSELAVGWCTYGADHLSSYNPNASVPKTLVKELIRWKANMEENLSEVLNDILGTPVSPELLPPSDDGKISQVSENNVGPYELIDYFLYHFLRTGMSASKICLTCFWAFSGKYTLQEIKMWEEKFIQRFGSQQFKRSCLPDGPKTGSISLSPRGDWRMPSDIKLTGYEIQS